MKTKNKKVFILIFLFSLSFFHKIKASDYYWVGGTGSWSDYANHWAITSGGLIFHIQTPGAFDNVIFDANSFVAAGDTVKIDSTLIYCNDMTWTGAAFSPTIHFPSSSVLKIYGSLALSPNMTFGTDYYGDISFESTTPGKTITSAGTALDISVTFNGIGGSWSLNDALTLSNGSGDLSIMKGSFYTNNFAVACNEFQISTTGTVDLGSSVITCYGSVHDNGSGSVTASATT